MMEHLPILHTALAMARLLEDRSLYHGLLRIFQEMHAGDMDKLDAALRRGQEREAMKLLHSLRGAASIVGAERLNAAASRLLRQSEGDSVASFEVLRAVFEQTLSAMRTELGDAS